MTSRPRLASFEDWNTALRSPVLPSHPIASPTSDAIVVTRYFLSPLPAPAPSAPEPAREIFLPVARSGAVDPARAMPAPLPMEIFLPVPSPQPIRLEPVTRDNTRRIADRRTAGQWNKPSRVENFLMRYDKDQALSTLVFVVLLLLWLI